jgi:hypothetical protein
MDIEAGGGCRSRFSAVSTHGGPAVAVVAASFKVLASGGAWKIGGVGLPGRGCHLPSTGRGYPKDCSRG